MAADGGGVPSIGGYGDLREIGRGGFGRVFVGLQFEFGRRVAVKVLGGRLVGESEVAAFERECQSMGALSRHPHIVTVLASAFTSDQQPCIVMDWFPLGDYMAALRRDGPLPAEELLSLGVRMAGALASAHRRGVVHGDVKPQNIFRSEFGYPALGDFGLATLAGRRGSVGPSRLSAHYAAPELVESAGASAAPAGDQYSLAATLHTLATGRRPFEAASAEPSHMVLARVVSQPPPRLPAQFPAALADVLQQAMARDRSDRYRDTAEFGTALRDVQSQLGLAPTVLPLADADDYEMLQHTPPHPTPTHHTSTHDDDHTIDTDHTIDIAQRPARRS